MSYRLLSNGARIRTLQPDNIIPQDMLIRTSTSADDSDHLRMPRDTHFIRRPQRKRNVVAITSLSS